MLAFNAEGPAGLVDGKAPGQPAKLSEAQRRALAEAVEHGPDPKRDGVVCWRRKDLAAWLHARFRVRLDETTVGRELKKFGFAKMSARPRHYAQDPAALEAFKKGAARRGGRDPRHAQAQHGDRAGARAPGLCCPSASLRR